MNLPPSNSLFLLALLFVFVGLLYEAIMKTGSNGKIDGRYHLCWAFVAVVGVVLLYQIILALKAMNSAFSTEVGGCEPHCSEVVGVPVSGLSSHISEVFSIVGVAISVLTGFVFLISKDALKQAQEARRIAETAVAELDNHFAAIEGKTFGTQAYIEVFALAEQLFDDEKRFGPSVINLLLRSLTAENLSESLEILAEIEMVDELNQFFKLRCHSISAVRGWLAHLADDPLLTAAQKRTIYSLLEND